MKITKRELIARIEEVEELNRIAARAVLDAADEQLRADKRAEQAEGAARLAEINHAEEVAELARAANASQQAYEAATSERGRRPVEPSRREKLLQSCLDELEALIRPRYDQIHEDGAATTLRDQLARILARHDDENDAHARSIEEIRQLARAVHGRIVGEDPTQLTMQEQLVEIGDVAAAHKRELRDRRSQLARVGQIVGSES